MIARGGHRIIDLLGHAGYWAYAQHHEAPPWSQVHQAWAQAASTITSAWDGHYGPLDTFDTWAEARGYRNEFARDYDHDDLVAAFAAGAHAVAIAAQQPQQGRPPRTTGLPGMDRLRQKAGVLEYTCGICGEEFGSNCKPGNVQCVNDPCEARLCPCCGAWFTGHGEIAAQQPPAEQAALLCPDPSQHRDVYGNPLPMTAAVPGEAARTPEVAAHDALLRDILESLCRRDGLSLGSAVVPGEPARNYELAGRLGIGHVFGLRAEPAAPEAAADTDMLGVAVMALRQIAGDAPGAEVIARSALGIIDAGLPADARWVLVSEPQDFPGRPA